MGAWRFPAAPPSPGIYRFRVTSAAGEHQYFGETVGLKRRFQHYRTPGPTQPTNLRLNALLNELLATGWRGEVAIITHATINLGGEAIAADLTHRAVRLLIENASLIAAENDGIAVENL